MYPIVEIKREKPMNFSCFLLIFAIVRAVKMRRDKMVNKINPRSKTARIVAVKFSEIDSERKIFEVWKKPTKANIAPVNIEMIVRIEAVLSFKPDLSISIWLVKLETVADRALMF